MNNLFSSPAYFNLEFKYFDKSYYANREIIQTQSSYVYNNSGLQIITLPSIKGPINELLNYLLGSSIQIEKQNAFFYELMSQFLELKNKNIESKAHLFLPNEPTLEMVDLFFKSQKQTYFNNSDVYTPYLKYINTYFTEEQDPYIPCHAVNIAIKKNINIDLKPSQKILQCLLKDLRNIDNNDERYKEIEKTIIDFIDKYSSSQLYRIILSCPYFDINKISKFKELITQSSSDKKYPNTEGGGIFESLSNDYETDFSRRLIPESSSSGNDIQIIDKKEPTLIYDFKTFTFDVESYSIQTDSDYPYPVTWSLYASYDLINYIEIHHCENSKLFKLNDKFTNIIVDKHLTFIRSIKFVVFKSSGNNSNNLSTLALKKFDIFGTSHKSVSYDKKKEPVTRTRGDRLLALLRHLDVLRHRAVNGNNDDLESLLRLTEELDGPLSSGSSSSNTSDTSDISDDFT